MKAEDWTEQTAALAEDIIAAARRARLSWATWRSPDA
jgi:hypothetical protein